MAATGADEELLKAAQALIVACEPKPGRPFTRSRSPDRRARRDRAEGRSRLEGGAQSRGDAQAAHQRLVCAGHQGPAQRRRRADVGTAAGSALVHEEHPAALRHHRPRVAGHRRAPEGLLQPRRDRHEAAGAARDRRRTRPAREHHLARDHGQVHGHADGHLRAEVLLRQRPGHRGRRQRVEHGGARADQAAGGCRGSRASRCRTISWPRCSPSRASRWRGARWPSTAKP